jgi:aspartate/methionine/tyrosine aminotransferase
MERICEIARRNDAYLLSDEVYRNLEWNGTISPAAVNFYEKAISAASVSKTMGLQGIRTGWMATRDTDLLYKCLILREDTSEVMNVLGEYIALAALKPEKFEKLLEEGKEEGRRCWPIVTEWIEKSNKFSWVKPKAGFLCLVKYDLDITSEDFCRRLLAEPYRTLVQPGAAYGFENYIRLGVGGGNAEEITRGLERIDKFVKEL